MQCRTSTTAVALAAPFLLILAFLVPSLGADNQATQPVARATPATRPAATQSAGDGLTRVYQVEGMHCGMCAQKIQKDLSVLPGVQSAKVSFDEKKAYVTVAPKGAPSDQKVQAVVEEAGYKASPATQPS